VLEHHPLLPLDHPKCKRQRHPHLRLLRGTHPRHRCSGNGSGIGITATIGGCGKEMRRGAASGASSSGARVYVGDRTRPTWRRRHPCRTCDGAEGDVRQHFF
jgi:hypothetical protein